MGVVAPGPRREVLTGRCVVRPWAMVFRTWAGMVPAWTVVVRVASVPLRIRVPEVMRTPQIEQVGSHGREQHERHNRAHPSHGDPRPASSCHRTLGK